nr:TaqI-like C-terminal specificity domain-containing protein [Chroococcidiopsis cubana]
MELQESVLKSLQSLKSLDALKKLFWSQLSYERVNKALSRRGWTAKVDKELEEDPVLLASGGINNDFHVIYARLKSARLSREGERIVVNRLLQDHPYTLFIFSNKTQSQWHFLNVKYDSTTEKRKLFRRITVGEGEQLRTATEQLSLLNLESINPDASPLEIQQRHDEAFDVEVVTNKFFAQYRQIFEQVEGLIKPTLTENERRRLFTQKLFNRLMFIAFIQKKGWLKFNGKTDYLSALWQDYQQDDSTANKNFYRDRLSHLFFEGLNNPQQQDIAGINNGGYFKYLIGTVPYLNGGLFERDEDDKDSHIIVPDECLDTILHDLFQRFAFTVTESTPLDVEVAVDPEMLGKVFEELVTDRHGSGSYYTPKPIVSFMCREALKGYLKSQVSGELTDAIEQFVDEHEPVNLGNHEAILEALRRVRTCDLAAGSGAYLLGMLHELLDLRQCLFNTKKLDSKSTYQRKLEIIENNLYGVDIDPFAVNIARLRLWLSLAVDYEGDNPPPLPNLKYKIEVGDSLIAPNPKRMGSIQAISIQQYRDAKARYMKAHLWGEKKALEQEITTLKTEIALLTHGSSKVSGFDWAVEFAEVFVDGGFDIVLANPPYVRQELIKHLKPTLEKVYPSIYTGKADLYCFFYARALELLNSEGMLTFISSNKWFRANYGEKLRKYIAETCNIQSITDFGDLPVFKTATAYPMIFIAKNRKVDSSSTIFTQVKSLEAPYPNVLAIIREKGQVLPHTAVNSSRWMLTDNTSANRLEKMELVGISLGKYIDGQIYYGVKTGFNKAFIIDGLKRAELIAKDPKSAEIIKPLAVGKDIRKWYVDRQERWLIFTRRDIDIDTYPAIKAHLAQWQAELTPKKTGKESVGRSGGDYKWYELQASPSNIKRLEVTKIVFPDIAKELRFAFDSKGMYLNNTGYFIPTNDLYLLGVLNSSVVETFYIELSTQIRGGYLRFFRQYVEKIPIPNASTNEREAISKLVQKCLDAKGIGCEVWEKEIDDRVAALYGL